MTTDPTTAGVATLATPVPRTFGEPPQRFELPIRFTGSGSEYFRIWIVNLLLTLVTLTLYYPWAKVRRLRYFYGNTLIDGQPLGFHATPSTMLRGYVLVGSLGVLYLVAGKVNAIAGAVAFLLIAAVWPALLRASMQFRLSNTSWRGLRFRFTGTTAGAYRAMLPWFVPGAIIIASGVAVADHEHPPAWFGVLSGTVGLAMMAVAPLLWWALKKYQHDHFAFGPLQTQLKSGPGAFYAVFGKTFCVAILPAFALGVVLALVAAARRGGGNVVTLVVLAVVVTIALLVILPLPYFRSRMQNLLWSRTGNRSMHFNSALRFLPLLGLTLKNWLLVVLTLGLYWPFAAVAMARLKLEAMSVTSRIDAQTLADQARGAHADATGEAAGDLFGLDIGF